LPPSPLWPSIDFIFLPILSLAIFALLSLQSLTLFFDFSKTLKQSLDFCFIFRLFLSPSLLTYLITTGLNDHTTHTAAATVSSTEVRVSDSDIFYIGYFNLLVVNLQMFDFDFLSSLFRFEEKVVKVQSLCYSPKNRGGEVTERCRGIGLVST
jgi:hypothetical protein